jgi:murein DD-endopeptidase MepM/ murein hydrolase activator NlpD
MDGMRSEPIARRTRWLVFLLTAVVFIACARDRVLSSKSSSVPTREKDRGVYHVVEKHQTLYRICKTYGVDMKEVASSNGIADHGKIQAGQRIFIPGAKKVLKVDLYIDDVASESNGKEQDKEAHRKIDFVWPVVGRQGDGFEEENQGRGHQGIDIGSPPGTTIRAAAPGTVLYSGDAVRGYGNLIILRHSEELVTVYAHNQVNLVEEGVWVEKGQPIGKVGQTGRATGPHLHFEVRKNNKAVDPRLYLR